MSSKAAVSWETMLRARQEWEREDKLRKQAKRLEQKRLEDLANAKRDQDAVRAGSDESASVLQIAFSYGPDNGRS